MVNRWLHSKKVRCPLLPPPRPAKFRRLPRSERCHEAGLRALTVALSVASRHATTSSMPGLAAGSCSKHLIISPCNSGTAAAIDSTSGHTSGSSRLHLPVRPALTAQPWQRRSKGQRTAGLCGCCLSGEMLGQLDQRSVWRTDADDDGI